MTQGRKTELTLACLCLR